MYLKRLELVGFKSFASKTVLDFPSGVTAIVGPNGSGKSNVIDAIRWLLGEREAKNIRGAKAEDLIFAGTPQKARLGMAQATIVFDNSTRFFPVDYAEVAIKRRVDRDGTSEYFLNDAQVRLKDIIDFFAKSRLGTKGFTIINQGSSDLFVRALPKERRAMLEEILGLRQFQLKKHEAERKLEMTQFNLEKVRAMIEELTPHLRLLRRQTGRWEKQDELKKELTELENKYFSAKLRNIEEEFKEFDPRLKELDKKINEKFEELKNFQQELKKVEDSQPKGDEGFNAFRKQQNELLNRRSTIQREFGRLEAQAELLLSKAKSGLKERELLMMLEEIQKVVGGLLSESDAEAIKKALKNLLDKIESFLKGGVKDLESLKAEAEQAKKKLADELEIIENELKQVSGLEGKLTAQLGEFNNIFKKAFGAVEAKRGEISDLNNQKNKTQFERERVNMKMQELENQVAQAGRKLNEFKSVAVSEEISFSEVERRIFRLRAEIAGIGEIDESLIKEAQETEARHNFLTSQSQDLDKALVDLHALIKELDDKIHTEFTESLKTINEEFNNYFQLMFGGGRAHMKLQKLEITEEHLEEDEAVKVEGEDEDVKHKVDHGGIDIELSIPRKRISGLDMLSGGEKSLVSIAALFALISVSPPPFLVLDEADAALDERNTKRFADLIKNFSNKTQFLLVTHNRATMEAANILYGVTMGEDGTSKVLSIKLE